MAYSPYKIALSTISRGKGGYSFGLRDPITMRLKAQKKTSPGCLPSMQTLIVGVRSWINND